MKKHLATALALGLALVSLVPGLAAAKLAGNHNQTCLRVAGLVAFAIVSLGPGFAAAKIAGNHNQTLLRESESRGEPLPKSHYDQLGFNPAFAHVLVEASELV